jgi:hypothetical protein
MGLEEGSRLKLRGLQPLIRCLFRSPTLDEIIGADDFEMGWAEQVEHYRSGDRW